MRTSAFPDIFKKHHFPLGKEKRNFKETCKLHPCFLKMYKHIIEGGVTKRRKYFRRSKMKLNETKEM